MGNTGLQQTLKSINDTVVGPAGLNGPKGEKTSKEDTKLPEGERYFGFVNVKTTIDC